MDVKKSEQNDGEKMEGKENFVDEADMIYSWLYNWISIVLDTEDGLIWTGARAGAPGRLAKSETPSFSMTSVCDTHPPIKMWIES